MSEVFALADRISVLRDGRHILTDRAAIGYPGQEARDSSEGLSDADLALLAKVQARPAPARDV